MIKKTLILFFILVTQFNYAQEQITICELNNHISFLASEELKGRYPGTKQNKKVVNYIRKEFKKIGLKKVKNSYKQKFKAQLRVENDKKPTSVKTYNIIGFIEGSDPVLKNEYLVLGAHYDHLGLGGPSSKSNERGVTYHGADDNASGVSSLLEIAEKIAHNKHLFKRSILFIAFGAEEQGLLGSKYFVNNPSIPISQIKVMINMDMVGRLNAEKHAYMGGAGTFLGGVKLMTDIGNLLGLNPIVHAGSVGGSDHVSFYKKNISVIGIHTGGHQQYHTPADTVDLINFEGQKLISEYIYNALLNIASFPEINFIKQD